MSCQVLLPHPKFLSALSMQLSVQNSMQSIQPGGISSTSHTARQTGKQGTSPHIDRQTGISSISHTDGQTSQEEAASRTERLSKRPDAVRRAGPAAAKAAHDRSHCWHPVLIAYSADGEQVIASRELIRYSKLLLRHQTQLSPDVCVEQGIWLWEMVRCSSTRLTWVMMTVSQV